MLKKKARAGKLYACIRCAGTGYITEIVEHHPVDFVCDACSGTGSIPLKGVINQHDRRINDNEHTNPTTDDFD